ncbi:hypothetical protein BSLG_007655 [Batrachochytrium salamandrivorans]|nr:hypothetical protein BSLG_007655 [Batrachochytrium salamandrivorans]
MNAPSDTSMQWIEMFHIGRTNLKAAISHNATILAYHLTSGMHYCLVVDFNAWYGSGLSAGFSEQIEPLTDIGRGAVMDHTFHSMPKPSRLIWNGCRRPVVEQLTEKHQMMRMVLAVAVATKCAPKAVTGKRSSSAPFIDKEVADLLPSRYLGVHTWKETPKEIPTIVISPRNVKDPRLDDSPQRSIHSAPDIPAKSNIASPILVRTISRQCVSSTSILSIASTGPDPFNPSLSNQSPMQRFPMYDQDGQLVINTPLDIIYRIDFISQAATCTRCGFRRCALNDASHYYYD